MIAIREASEFGRPVAFELFLQAVARLAAGRPLNLDDLRHRLSSMEDFDLRAAHDVYLAAYSAPDPRRSRQPIAVDRRTVDGHALAMSGFLISTAVLAAREQDWSIAARLLAAASAPGGLFAGAADHALYRLTVPLVRAALDKSTRDALIADARARSVSDAVELAIQWLAMNDVDEVGEVTPS